MLFGGSDNLLSVNENVTFSEYYDQETQLDTAAAAEGPLLSDIVPTVRNDESHSRTTCKRLKRTNKMSSKFQDYVMTVKDGLSSSNH